MNKRMCFLNSRGVFLLEAVIAVTILSVGLIAIIRSFTMGIEAHMRSQEYLIASTLLDNKLTELLLDRYIDEGVTLEGEFEEPFLGYRYVLSVESLDQYELLKRVNVSIFWKGRVEERFIDAATYLFVRPESVG